MFCNYISPIISFHEKKNIKAFYVRPGKCQLWSSYDIFSSQNSLSQFVLNRKISLEILRKLGFHVINKKNTLLITWLFAFHEVDKTSRLQNQSKRCKKTQATHVFTVNFARIWHEYESVHYHNQRIDKSVQDLQYKYPNNKKRDLPNSPKRIHSNEIHTNSMDDTFRYRCVTMS